jgi:hypothetical protein
LPGPLLLDGADDDDEEEEEQAEAEEEEEEEEVVEARGATTLCPGTWATEKRHTSRSEPSSVSTGASDCTRVNAPPRRRLRFLLWAFSLPEGAAVVDDTDDEDDDADVVEDKDDDESDDDEEEDVSDESVAMEKGVM